MQRPLPEVLASQEVMQRHRGTDRPGADAALIASGFEKNLRAVDAWLESKSYVKTLRVPYHEVLRDAEATAMQISEFLGITLDLAAMAQQVDATLYRNRGQ
jgi:hypothetical protein